MKILKIIAAVVIILAIPAIIMKVMSGRSDPAKTLTKLADDTNAGLPRRIDTMTTLTRVEYDRKVWRIHYTMDNGSPIDPAQADTYKNFALKQICAGDMKKILDEKITIEYLYTYFDASGEKQLRLSITPGSC